LGFEQDPGAHPDTWISHKFDFTPAGQASQNRKEVKTMRYNKPEVAVLGSASRVIENLVKSHDFSTDIYTQTTGMKGKVQTPPPAYDLDE